MERPAVCPHPEILKASKWVPALLLLLPLTACNTAPQSPPAQPAATGQTTPYRPHSNRAHVAAAPGSFDLYLLNLSWSPEYCHSHSGAAECASHSTFVLHGLWPENADGTYPSDCSDAPGPANPAQYSGLYPDPGLLQHEWQTHGTCSGLSPDAYFQAVRTAFQSVIIPPTFTHLASQISLTPAQIQVDFAASNPNLPAADTLISCGNNYLTAVEVCLDKTTLHPVACPTSIPTCRANMVRVPAP